MLTRRTFLKASAATGALVGVGSFFRPRRAFAFSQSPIILNKFQTPLPGLGLDGIPLATKSPGAVGPQPVDVYNLGVAEFSQSIPGLPNKTHFWGYYDLAAPDPAKTQRYLSGVIVATRGTPVLLTVTNQLPNHQLIPIDGTIMAGPNITVRDLPLNRIVTHLHGGFTPWISDGTPFQWFTPNGVHDVSFMNVPGTNPLPGTATYYYPMDQSARLVWYHDHAVGITRTNAYSGIASALIITDAFETYLNAQGLIPNIGAPYLYLGIPLVIQDKTFLNIDNDPNYPVAGAQNGDLWYPWEYEANSLPNGKGRWDYGPDVGMIPAPIPLPPIAEVPEFFADTAMVNGAPYPSLPVTDGTFRFRLLNASQARFWHVNLYEEDGTTGEIKLVSGNPVPGPTMYQIGTEGGFLPAWVAHDNTTPIPLNLAADSTGNTANPDGPFNLLLAPAERADILIDFTGKAGKRYILYGDAPAPFPGGDPRNDYYTGDPDFTSDLNNTYQLSGGAPKTLQGQGPNTRTIMEIVVNSGTNNFELTPAKLTALSTALKNNFILGNPGVAPQQAPLLYHGADLATPGPVPLNPALLPAGTTVRNLTLNEDFDDYGRLIQREGTTSNLGLTTVDGLTVNGLNNQGMPTWGRSYLDNPTETPNVGAVEVWNIFNRTGDTHPIHFHLVNVQVIQRARFNVAPDGSSDFTIDPNSVRGPDANEMGWKETVRMNGVVQTNQDGSTVNEVTTVIAKFDLPKVPFTVPFSTRDAFPINSSEYVWHCHILEHEEHDMMRPLVVLGPNPLAVFPPAQTDPKKSTVTYAIYNGVPPYTITSDDKKFPPVPATVGASAGTFNVAINNGVNPHNNTVTYTIKDSAGTIVTATLTITKK